MKYDIESIQKRKRTYSKLRRIMYVFIVILVYNIILLSISYCSNLNFDGLFGYKAYAITTTSMENTINNGDAVIVKKCTEEQLKENDIITFKKDGEYITHRIIAIDEKNGKKEFTTKGDNNTIEDNKKVVFNEIQGIEVMKIPFLGHLISIATNSIFIILIILVILIIYLYKIKIDEKKEVRREKKEIEDEKFSEK